MDNKEQTPRPLILELEELKRTLTIAVNSAVQMKGIPCYFVEPILSDLCSQVRENARQELESVRSQYEATLEKSKQEE